MTSIVVTGVGAVLAGGTGEEIVRSILAGKASPTLEVDTEAGYHRPQGSRRAVLVGEIDLSAWLPPRQARRMSPPSRFAVAAASMAQAIETSTSSETGVYVATSYGPSSFTEGILRQILEEGAQAVSPFLFTESVANAPAAQVAIAAGATGPNITLTQRDAGPFLAAREAALALSAGRIERALVGAVDEVNPLLHAVLDRMGALSTADGGCGRPFDRRRDGFVVAEGAAVLRLESGEQTAGSPLARLLACGAAFDPTATRVNWGRGAADLGDAVREGLGRSGIPLDSIDLVVTGASGARDGDRAYAGLVRQLWPGSEATPPVTAPFGASGNCGPVLLACGALAASGEVGPTAGFEESDPTLDLSPLESTLSAQPRRVLAVALAPGGAASWCVFEGVA